MIAVVGTSPLLEPVVMAASETEHTERWSQVAPGSVDRAVRFALRAWARGQTDRRYLSDFALRVATDAWAAREVRLRRPSTVIACSLGARHTLAAAREVGATAVLVMDLPQLRALHRDLDRAAAVWPDRTFLRRFRAPSWAIARQEAERVLADVILVRGPYAKSVLIADGVPATKIAPLPLSPGKVLAAPATPTRRVLLAGLAAARHGVDTAVAAAREAGVTLVVRVGDGTEPRDLAAYPNVAAVAGDPGPVDAVICPAVCETYAPELRATGIPVIASPMASADGHGPDPFDPTAFAAMISHSIGGDEGSRGQRRLDVRQVQPL